MKNLPYWLKGGIIAILIGYILIYVTGIFMVIPFVRYMISYTLNLPITLFWIFFPKSFSPFSPTYWITGYIILIAYYFIIGAIVGLIYGKIKK